MKTCFHSAEREQIRQSQKLFLVMSMNKAGKFKTSPPYSWYLITITLLHYLQLDVEDRTIIGNILRICSSYMNAESA